MYTTFLNARLAEDRTNLEMFLACEWHGYDYWGEGTDVLYEFPEKALIDIKAKQELVSHLSDNPQALALLCEVYRDHPDYPKEK